MFCAHSTPAPMSAQRRTGLASERRESTGQMDQPSAASASSATGSPHSAAHCSGRFSACSYTIEPAPLW
jgi:hypothetical protein